MTDPRGKLVRSGCVFWIIALVVAPIIILALAASPVVMPLIEAKRDNAAARREFAAAEANRAEAEKTHAESLQSTVETYNEAAARAIEADTYAAHPWLYLIDALKALAVAVAGGFIIVTVVLLLAWWGAPKETADFIRLVISRGRAR